MFTEEFEKRCVALVHKIEENLHPGRPLLLLGSLGTGKCEFTRLAAAEKNLEILIQSVPVLEEADYRFRSTPQNTIILLDWIHAATKRVEIHSLLVKELKNPDRIFVATSHREFEPRQGISTELLKLFSNQIDVSKELGL